MSASSERAPRGGLGRLVVSAVAFAIIAPIGLIALPLAALLLLSQPKLRRELVVAGMAAGFSAWWLLVPGPFPDQLVRAAAVIATVVFVFTTLRTRSSFVHRALLAVSSATLGAAALVAAVGASWGELRWSVARQTGHAARVVIGMLWMSADSGTSEETVAPAVLSMVGQLETLFGRTVQYLAEFYPAIVGLELMGGMALALAIYHRVAGEPRGAPLGQFRNYRFNEHLGWAVVVPLLLVLIPKLAVAKTAAGNLLLVVGTLYALRGLAVAAFGLHVIGGVGFFVMLFMGVLTALLLPAVLAGALVLGVLDAGLDLRKRWAMRPTK